MRSGNETGIKMGAPDPRVSDSGAVRLPPSLADKSMGGWFNDFCEVLRDTLKYIQSVESRIPNLTLGVFSDSVVEAVFDAFGFSKEYEWDEDAEYPAIVFRYRGRLYHASPWEVRALQEGEYIPQLIEKDIEGEVVE